MRQSAAEPAALPHCRTAALPLARWGPCQRSPHHLDAPTALPFGSSAPQKTAARVAARCAILGPSSALPAHPASEMCRARFEASIGATHWELMTQGARCARRALHARAWEASSVLGLRPSREPWLVPIRAWAHARDRAARRRYLAGRDLCAEPGRSLLTRPRRPRQRPAATSRARQARPATLPCSRERRRRRVRRE